MHSLPGGPAAATPLKIKRNNEDGRREVDYLWGRATTNQTGTLRGPFTLLNLSSPRYFKLHEVFTISYCIPLSEHLMRILKPEHRR